MGKGGKREGGERVGKGRVGKGRGRRRGRGPLGSDTL